MFSKKMRICIVGAGAAGLASAKQVIDEKHGYEAVIFEQTGEIGGTWIYTDEIGFDENGFPIHTSMYKNLRTNLPKEVMGFPDFKIPDYKESYITQEQILLFLNSYADHFNLRPLIQFNHRVKYIEPQEMIWKVTVTNLKTKIDSVQEFDAIMICNGHYHTPRYPKIPGSDIFTGKQIHSHDFRDIKDFEGQKVVIIGAGPSGIDLAINFAEIAKEVYLSHHSKDEFNTHFPKNLIEKPDVISMTEEEVIFKDNSKVKVDVIMYCTGYLYAFPFLDEKSRITVDDNHVQPLYNHLINIHYPTMCFIGLPAYVCAFSMFDLQARFFLAFLQGNFQLPSKEIMLQELSENLSKLPDEGLRKRHFHIMGPKQAEYYEKLSKEANIKSLPPVLAKIHSNSTNQMTNDLINFRKEIYKIIDDYNYITLN